MGSQALAGKRGQVFYLPPETLTLITDPASPLYDERVHLPPDEVVVLNMMRYGVKVPLKVRKNGEGVEVVDGRRRTINAREANRRLEAEGREPLLVKCEVERGRDKDHADTMILCNELRRGDDPVTRALKVQRYLNGGRTPEEAGMVWGVSPDCIERWQRVLDLHEDVQGAVKAGRITFTSAVDRYSKLSREAQVKLLQGADAPNPSGKPKRASKPATRRIREVAATMPNQVREALLWAVGDLKASEVTNARLKEAIKP